MGHRTQSLGVEHFGQSGSIDDLFQAHRIDATAIKQACISASQSRTKIVKNF